MKFTRIMMVILLTLGACRSTIAGRIEEPFDEAAARQLIATYIAAHNAHRIDEVMALYAEDAVFRLSSGRPPVHGRTAIRELELFDVAAGSHLAPYGVSFSRNGTGWAVHIAGVIEHSAIFSAIGLETIRTEPVVKGFTLVDGRIAEVIQPEFRPACTSVASSAFGLFNAWINTANDPELSLLQRDGRLRLEADNIALFIKTLGKWRSESGWSPDAAMVIDCAGSSLFG